jgi:hypothetical protein
VLSIDRISTNIILSLGAVILTLLIDVLTAKHDKTMPYVLLKSYLIIGQDSCVSHTGSHSGIESGKNMMTQEENLEELGNQRHKEHIQK